MKTLASFSSKRSMITAALVIAMIIIYPTLGEMTRMWIESIHKMPLGTLPNEVVLFASLTFCFQYMCYSVVLYLLIKFNVKYALKWKMFKRLAVSCILASLLDGIFLGVILHFDRFDISVGTAMLQGLILWLAPFLVGHMYRMSMKQIRDAEEIEQLKLESLQSRCDALTNQINPHFFFNSLSGISYLIRENQKDRSLDYVNKLSSIFRYILQSEKRCVVPLAEEIDFLNAYSFTLQVRYGDRFEIRFDVDEAIQKSYTLPVLSLLPLVENIVKHNAIDSDNRMVATLSVNEKEELVVSNPIHPKLDPPVSNGIGLTNLSNRYQLLMGREIRISNDGETFRVFLPLKHAAE